MKPELRVGSLEKRGELVGVRIEWGRNSPTEAESHESVFLSPAFSGRREIYPRIPGPFMSSDRSFPGSPQ